MVMGEDTMNIFMDCAIGFGSVILAVGMMALLI